MTKYKERILDTDWSILNEYDACESYFLSFMNIFDLYVMNRFQYSRQKEVLKSHSLAEYRAEGIY